MLISTKNMPLHCNKMLLHGLCLARVLILATGILVAKFLTTWYGTRKSVLWRKNSAVSIQNFYSTNTNSHIHSLR